MSKKRNYFAKYGEKAKQILEALLEKYTDQGIEEIESLKILQLDPFRKMGTPKQLIKQFGSKENYLEAVLELERILYTETG